MIVLLLDIGPAGEQEVHFTKWLVADGDLISANQPIAEVDTDKVTIEINSEAAGIIRFLTQPDEKIKNGHEICHIEPTMDAMVKEITDKF